MPKTKNNLNPSVTQFLDALNHPFRAEIEALRHLILNSNLSLTEDIKWNGPNYCFNNEDRITMSIQPPKQVRIVLHCGAKVKTAPKEKLIKNDYGILDWKGNDRAIATFKSMNDVERMKESLTKICIDWIEVTK
jgi:hypothetical protein